MADVTLHEELAAILAANGNRWMSTADLARSVNARGQYQKRDRSPVDAGQVHARTRVGGFYEDVFERNGRLVRRRTPLGAREAAAPQSELEEAASPGPSDLPSTTSQVHSADSDALVQNALAALRGPRYAIEEAYDHVPAKPGLYAIYGSSEDWRDLGLGDPPDDRPLYVGTAEESLRDRDLRQHFADGRTGSSTVRRSFAALLHDGLGLTGMPRNPAKPAYFANYGLSQADDARLTAWMRDRLELAWWAPIESVVLLPIERPVIATLKPPLNLTNVRTEWSDHVSASRARMASEARASVGRSNGSPA